MAHADYECCAVCDSKQAYSECSDAKSAICGPCVADLARLGVITGTPEELVKWVNENPVEKVGPVLAAVGFKPCFYDSTVDAAVEKKCPGVFVR
jgi:hypothetical protein